MRPLTLRAGRMAIGLSGLLLAAGYMAVGGRTLSLGSAEMPGPALFPLLIGPLLGLAALALLLESRRTRAPAGGHCGATLDLPTGEEARRAVLVLLALALHLLAMPWIGHLLSAALVSVALIRLLRGGGWLAAAAWGLALAVGAQFLFVRLLQVPMPRGETGLSSWLGM